MKPLVNKKPKIIFLISCFDKGGMVKVVCDVANLLANEYSISLVTFTTFKTNYYFEVKNSFKFQFIDIQSYRLLSSSISGILRKLLSEIRGGYRLFQIIRNIKPTIIVCTDAHGIFWAYFIRPWCKFSIYMWSHIPIDSYISQKSWLWRKIVLRRVKNYIAINKDMEQGLKRKFPKAQVSVIYNMIDTKQSNFIKFGNNFIYMGRINNNPKRLDRLFKALSFLTNPYWHLQIIGDGPDEIFLRNLSIELGINDKITWSGWQTNPWDTLDSASFGILSSDYEGFSLVTAEGIYHGLPYICMDCPVGPREIIKEGINGILVPLSKNEDENVKNLSLTLQKALEGKIKIGTQMEIRESVMQFMPEKIVKDWKKLLSAN